MTSLSIRNLVKEFAGGQARALDNVSVTVSPGELLVLLGPSGSGKTTLLRGVAGLLSPSGGQILLDDVLVSDGDRKMEMPPYKRNLGMVFQSFALWAHMTVRQNIGYPLDARRWPADQRARRIEEMLKLVQCEHLADRLPGTLSGGQQQRVALARALAPKPALVLFDEPLSNLDALLREELRRQLRLIHRETKFTGVYVTHDQIEALSLGTRIAVMNNGAIEQVGTPEDIYFDPRSEFVAKFMGFSNVLPADTVGFEGTANSIRFRPDDARVVPVGSSQGDDKIAVPVHVLDRAFMGEWMEYTVRAGDEMVKARMPVNTSAFAVEGEAILEIPRNKLKLFCAGRRVVLPLTDDQE